MAEIVVNYALDKLTALLTEEVQLHRGVKEEAQTIAEELKRIEVYLRAADEIIDRSPEVKASAILLREVAYDIEDALDEYNLRVACPPGDDLPASLRNFTSSIRKIRARHQIASEIQRLKFRVLSIAEGYNRFRPENPTADIKIAPKTWDSRRQDALLLEEADLVGIEIPKKELISWLLQGDTEREVVSVVGMGGLGKTTLVKKVYDDAEVKLQFKYRAWITVSRSFNLEELLKGLVRQLYKVKRKPVPQEVEGMDEGQLRTKINSFLQQKKYLIVLDDVWHTGDWDAVKFAFPKNSSSRVMLTTRHAEVASASCMDFNDNVTKVYRLNPLSPEESWTLFCRKTFEKSKSAPDSNWKTLADSILERCEGLPLAIVTISGVLATKSIDEWDMIQRSLADGLEENDRLDSIEKILSLSYYDLPYYLKSCFLYLSIFPYNHPIDKMRLIRLWIAEGFVKVKEGMTLEEVAEAYYFDELLSRSLIQVAGTTGEGRIKTCRIHDRLREIIIRKSKEENFLTIVRENMMLPEKVRRLSIQKSMQDVHDRQRMPRLRSLLMFRRVDSLSKSYNPILHLLDLRLVKVLDLEGAPDLEIFPNEISRLFHLKYLSLRSTKIKIIPSSIGNLQNLETLDLKNTFVTALPAEISRLQKLRHLLVYRYEVQSYALINSKYGFKATANITCLRSLQKLCFIEADDGGNDIMKELGCLNQLRRLGIVKFRTENGVALCSSIEKLKNLRALSINSIKEDEIINLDCLSCPPRFLQRLYLTGKLEKFPHWISSLHSLAKVSLKWSQLRDDPLESLQGLPNLAQLDFLQVYEGETLHFKAGFQKLKILSLDKMEGLKSVIVDMGAMPLLEKLILRRCRLLHSLPSGIEHLTKLKLLEFWDMPAELIMTIRLDIEGGDYWKVKHVPEINSTYWRDGRWDVYSLYRSIDSEVPAPARNLGLPSYWK